MTLSEWKSVVKMKEFLENIHRDGSFLFESTALDFHTWLPRLRFSVSSGG